MQNVRGLEETMKEIERRKPSSVVFFVQREARTLYLELQPAWTPADGRPLPRP